MAAWITEHKVARLAQNILGVGVSAMRVQSKGKYACLPGINRVCRPRWLRVDYLTRVHAPALSYLDKTHITALEYPIALSIIIDLRHTGTDEDEIRRRPGDKGRATHLVPVSQSDKHPSRDVLKTRNGISAAVCAVSGYETRGIFTLQFQKSIDSSTTTITVCQGVEGLISAWFHSTVQQLRSWECVWDLVRTDKT